MTRGDALLTIVQGDPLDVPALAGALEGQDAVISTLGPSVRETLGKSSRMTDWGRSTVAAMQAAHVQRIAILSAAVLFPLTGVQYRFFRWLLRHHARDLAGMEALVQEARTEWTIVRPPRLVESSDERYIAQSGGLPAGASTASFRAVAKFLVDAVEQRAHLAAVVGLVGAR